MEPRTYNYPTRLQADTYTVALCCSSTCEGRSLRSHHIRAGSSTRLQGSMFHQAQIRFGSNAAKMITRIPRLSHMKSLFSALPCNKFDLQFEKRPCPGRQRCILHDYCSNGRKEVYGGWTLLPISAWFTWESNNLLALSLLADLSFSLLLLPRGLCI